MKNNTQTKTSNKTFRDLSKGVHRSKNVRGVGNGLIDELKKELLPTKVVKK